GGRDATFEGDPQWTASGAPLGQESVVVDANGTGAVGPTNAALTVTTTDAPVTLYRYGDASAEVFDDEEIPRGQRSKAVWGAVPTAMADLELTYGDVTVPNPSAVGLAERPGPTQPWTARAEEPSGETFTLTGQTDSREFVLYDNAPSILYVDAAASGTGTGASWSDAYPDLEDALSAALSSDVIVIAAGTYTPSRELNAGEARTATFEVTGEQDGLTIYGGWSGSETFGDASEVEDALDGRNLPANATVLSGNINDDENDDSGNAYHVLVFNGGDSIGADVDANLTPDTVLDGVTITGGNANGATTQRGTGGGLYCDGQGSGNACSPTLSGLTFTGNTANAAGAMLNDGNEGGTSSPVITNVVFAGNSGDLFGGAIYNFGSSGTSSPVITNATFTGNTTDEGGAIYNDGRNGGTSSPQITNTILWGNDASNDGDEIYNREATPTLTHTLIEGGLASISENDGSSTTDGGNNIDADPLFADAAAGDARLTAGSPAIARGTFAPFASGGIAEDVTTDLAGEDRIFGARPDLGAFTFNDIATTSSDIADAAGLLGYLEPTGFDGLVLLRENTAANGGLTLTRTGEAPTDPSDELPGNVAPFTWTVTSDLDTDPHYDLLLSTEDLGGISDFGALMLYKSDDGGQTWNAVDTFSGASLVLDEDRALVAVQDLTGFSQFAIASSTADNPLPVELAGFEAQRSGTESITVQWETLSETNNAGFEVQRSVPSNVETSRRDVSTGESWQTITTLNGAGTTDTPQSYRFEDTDLPYAADSLSYRLRQIDTGGTESFSEAVTIARQVTQAELLPTYPNPVRHQATVRFAVPDQQAVRIDLYDMLGRRVQTVVDGEQDGRTEQQLDVSRLSSGTYFLRMQTSSHTETQRVTVVR
ncbi:MAG: T9SS type A sorting domain-containing protein, partial [Longimonas sp.]|uniref:T9SS type A sorting domain-containing protein n=1 Tax=Longimonas sp. TaxID=2039626 RepID=UPI003975AA67